MKHFDVWKTCATPGRLCSSPSSLKLRTPSQEDGKGLQDGRASCTHVPRDDVVFSVGNSNLSCLLPPVPCLARLDFSFWRSATISLPYLGRQGYLHTQKGISIGCTKEGCTGGRNKTLAWLARQSPEHVLVICRAACPVARAAAPQPVVRAKRSSITFSAKGRAEDKAPGTTGPR